MDHASYAKQIKEVITQLEMNHKNESVKVDPSVHAKYQNRYVIGRHAFFSSVEGQEFIAWVTKEADAGNSYAEDYLGELYYCGIIRTTNAEYVEEKDYNRAMDLFKRSADKGNRWGQFDLGYLYFHCHIPKMHNEVLGQKYLVYSAINGHPSARFHMMLGLSDADWQKLVEKHKVQMKCEKLEKENQQLREENTQLTAEINILNTELEYEQGSVSNADCPERVKEHTVQMKWEELEKENQQLKEENTQLKAEIDMLKTELEYRPGGAGYYKAKENAEGLFDLMNQLVEKN